MRITSGIYKGINIILPKSSTIRPTSEKIRMALFNTLGDLIINTTLLDIFAGSGAIGIEALSRKASSVDFLEKDPQLCNMINNNLEKLKLQNSCKVFQGNATSILKQLNSKYDFIFADPPYEYKNKEEILSIIEKSELLNPEGMIILEHRSNENINETLLNIEKFDVRKYGDTQISFYKNIK
ncbi:MAG: 16S rRNA (guanine(966)-N(2))-methyltransferase RsmD [SAR202 cluster bacterium]|nr:16S rRNA (guanine(966)-N(2))-methyltransferase RsmD [Chloroflexota bacterium]MQG51213.1 16S rRNA (guanine(966)-N(2))-methyltransferase RsmD [SAR202 cluster bacterium]